MTRKLVITKSQNDAGIVLARDTTLHIIDTLKQHRKTHGEDASKWLAMQVLSSYISAISYGTLTSNLFTDIPKNLTNKQIDSKLMEDFAFFKLGLQEAISAGIQGAMVTYSGQPIEYYCKISVLPESINKLPA